MQTIIYLIRHGEVHNPDGIIYGRLPNYGLSENGKKEVAQTAEFLKNKHIDTLYSSPLTRAQQSAKIIKEKIKLPAIITSEAVIETRTSYRGRPFRELDLLQSEVYLKPLSPNDETIEQIATRMMSFIKKLVNEYPGKRIAIVGHGDPIMAVKAAIKRNSFEFYQFKTDQYIHHAEVYEVKADGNNHFTITSVFKPAI